MFGGSHNYNILWVIIFSVAVTVIIVIRLSIAVMGLILLQFEAVLSDMSRFATKREIISPNRVFVIFTIVALTIFSLKWLMADLSTIYAFTFELIAEQSLLF
jgi:hypothetical protein